MGRHIRWYFLILGLGLALSSCNNGLFSSFSYPLSEEEKQGIPSGNPDWSGGGGGGSGGGSIEIIIPDLSEDE